MGRQLKVGIDIVFIDSHRVHHVALVTHVWPTGQADMGGKEPGCNLVYVEGDESKTDPYGRQIKRETSVVHLTAQPAGCACWCWPDEGVPSV
jgi:hypothetical protein